MNNPVEDAIDDFVFRYQQGEISYDEVHTEIVRVVWNEAAPSTQNRYLAYAGLMLAKACLSKSNST